MAQHRRTNSSGPDSPVHIYLKEKKHSFEDNNVNILVREDSGFTLKTAGLKIWVILVT